MDGAVNEPGTEGRLLSRFVVIRRDGDALLVESPLSWCEVRLHDPAALGLAAEDAGLLADAAGAPGVSWYVSAVAAEAFTLAVHSGGMDRIPPAHTARYIPDVENALPVAVAALLGAAGSWLGLRVRPPGSGRGELAKLPARLAD